MRRGMAWCVGAVLALAALTQPATAAAAGCAALDYQSGLAAADRSLREVPADVDGARRQLQALVRADAGSIAALQRVLSDLSTVPPDVDDARLRVESMSATLAYPPGSVCNVNGDAARTALHGVYASPDFRQLDSPRSSPLATIAAFIAGLIRRAGAALGAAGAALLALAVVALFLVLVWRRARGSRARDAAEVDDSTPPGDDPDAEWRAAQRAAQSGDYREAVRRAFRSALLDIALQGHAQLDPTWTTRELLARVEAGAEVLVPLAAAAALFERAWYSVAPVARDDWIRAEERCAVVRRLARHRPAATR